MMATAEERELQPRPIQQRIFLWFCATVLAGVILFVAYLSGRAAGGVSSRRNHPADVPLPRVRPSLAATSVQPPLTAIPRSAQSLPAETYLQLAALDRARAEAFVETLARNGFHAVVASGPTEDIFRVLVGPLEDTATLARTQADLQALGFTSFPRKNPAQ
jgi:cell division septation protein DedD